MTKLRLRKINEVTELVSSRGGIRTGHSGDKPQIFNHQVPKMRCRAKGAAWVPVQDREGGDGAAVSALL